MLHFVEAETRKNGNNIIVNMDGYTDRKTVLGAVHEIGKEVAKYDKGEGELLLSAKTAKEAKETLVKNASYDTYCFELEEVSCASCYNEEDDTVEYADGTYYFHIRFIIYTDDDKEAKEESKPAQKADRHPYKNDSYKVELKHNSDGYGYIDLDDVKPGLNISTKNSKIGEMLNISFPIHYTCDHCKDCYKRKECYGARSTYCFPDNQRQYAENLKFFIENDVDTIISALSDIMDYYPSYNIFRWFCIGDIYSKKVIAVMVGLAKKREDKKFYAYSKKIELVNSWIAENGMFPKNLNVMLSKWTDENGNIETICNPYGLTETVFIPYGKEEELLTSDMFVCPCGKETWSGTCVDCHGCPYNKHKTIAFLEHSTTKTRERDKTLKTAQKEARKARKEAQKARKEEK